MPKTTQGKKSHLAIFKTLDKDIVKAQSAIQRQTDPDKQQQMMAEYNDLKEQVNSFALNQQEGTIRNVGSPKVAEEGEGTRKASKRK